MMNGEPGAKAEFDAMEHEEEEARNEEMKRSKAINDEIKKLQESLNNPT